VNSTWLTALAGGALIGASASLLLVARGRVAGISGIVDGLLDSNEAGERSWRVLFLAGLLAGGAAVGLLSGPASAPTVPLPQLVIAGLLVGFGARLGNGCTSGHGICGLSRFSPRSAVSVITFMAVAAATVYVTRHLLGGAA
jgi:uncharacterized protein